ncbi:MAG: methyltransferase domain-containing protein [Candidatus Azambacteria bacterium]|nr:methyltransferase domain-containing protein [Candidatus Azambacteria bacterium]
MFKNFAKYFQKIKWDILARIKPNYFVYSGIKNDDENKYINSGHEDVFRLIVNDNILKSKIDFNNAVALEIGCGNGRMSQFIGENFKKVYAVDISPHMIDLARRRLTNHNNIEFLVTDGGKLPVQDNIADFVFSYIVFQHFPNVGMVEENLKEVKRVLKNNGIAKIQFRGRVSTGGAFRVFKWYYGVFFSEKELNNILEKNGLKPIKIYKTNEKELWAIFGK